MYAPSAWLTTALLEPAVSPDRVRPTGSLAGGPARPPLLVARLVWVRTASLLGEATALLGRGIPPDFLLSFPGPAGPAALGALLAVTTVFTFDSAPLTFRGKVAVWNSSDLHPNTQSAGAVQVFLEVLCQSQQ